MLRKAFFALTLAASFSLVGTAAVAADPTLHQVYQAAEAGNYREAQAMMDQVLRDHPDSGKAHFVEAELLAKQGRVSEARSELAAAERLAPGLPFATPRSVQELKALVAAPTGAETARPLLSSPTNSGFPWGSLLLVVGLVALVVAVVRMMRQRAASAAQRSGFPAYGAGGVPSGYGAGATAPVAPASGTGSGILGSLATGAAVGAGVVAGEALMHRILDGHRQDGMAAAAEDSSWDNSQPQYDMGGNDFGVSDDSSWDDGSSGGGGDDWN